MVIGEIKTVLKIKSMLGTNWPFFSFLFPSLEMLERPNLRQLQNSASFNSFAFVFTADQGLEPFQLLTPIVFTVCLSCSCGLNGNNVTLAFIYLIFGAGG